MLVQYSCAWGIWKTSSCGWFVLAANQVAGIEKETDEIWFRDVGIDETGDYCGRGDEQSEAGDEGVHCECALVKFPAHDTLSRWLCWS